MKAIHNKRKLALLCGLSLLLTACATKQPAYDYSALRAARPVSILVLPPTNSSPDVRASYSLLSQTTRPLAESGYYVLPVTLVDETFKQNGLTSAADIREVRPARLREIFGADAALYINVSRYGTSYSVIASETRVTAEAELVDLRSGEKLWSGSATASSAEGDNNNNGGLIGLLLKAAIRQISETVREQGHVIAGLTSARLLGAGRPNGLLYGPRSPYYLKDGLPAE